MNRIEGFDWAVASLPIPGEEISGDACLVSSRSNGLLAAVVDGVGHGPEARAVSDLVISILQKNVDQPLETLLSLCHQSLRSTRGAVLSMALFQNLNPTLSWCGVGNVEGHLFRKNSETTRESLLLRNGTLGMNFPPPRFATLPLQFGDTLIFATDGIQVDFYQNVNSQDSCQAIADSILSQFRKGTDDALVLVVRYLGGSL
jgi:serine phosphatase RsbU (regulator of sigma subunit)